MAEEDILRNTDYIAYDKKSPDTALQLSRGFCKGIQNRVVHCQWRVI